MWIILFKNITSKHSSIVTDDSFSFFKRISSAYSLMINYNVKPLLPAIAIILTLILIPSAISSTYAQSSSGNDFVSVNADRIKNDPVLAKILENIEKSRQEFSEIQQKTDQEKFVDEQRNISKKILEQNLEQMFEDNKDFTSLAAFNNFLKTVSDDNTKDIFKGLFDYKQNKIDSAKSIMGDILRNGGSLQDARNAYHDALQIPRSDMIQLVNSLNIEAGFSNPTIQDHFDDDGKLPRYEDEAQSVVSFVDLTTSAKNVNSSPVDTNETIEDLGDITTKNESSSDESSSVTTEDSLVQKLLEEIQFLKNRIADLEKSQNTDLQQTVFEPVIDSTMFFASWVSDYSKGTGHNNSEVDIRKSIPVKALNEPNSYSDPNNSLSLGKGGQVTIGFSEPVTDKIVIYETTKGQDITERAVVEVSVDGEKWHTLKQLQYDQNGSSVHEYAYDLSDIGCISQVRITDMTYGIWGDGFDVDALGATKLCSNST